MQQTSCHGELVGLRDDSRQSRVPGKPSDWRDASESSAGRTGLSCAGDFRGNGRIFVMLEKL